MTSHRSGWVAGLLAVALVGLVGCANGVPASGRSRLPARPTELRLDGIDPCALLTTAQVSQLGVDAGERAENTDELGSVDCQWQSPLGEQPDVGYLARSIVKRGADYALNSATGAQVVALDGFSAVQTSSPHVDPKQHCLLLIDVAQGESLWVQWMMLSGDTPDLTHEVACQKAQDAARLMLGNLQRLSG